LNSEIQLKTNPNFGSLASVEELEKEFENITQNSLTKYGDDDPGFDIINN